MESSEVLTYRPRDLAKALNVSLVTLHRLNSSGKIPRPAKLSRVVFWPVEEIRSWLAAGSPDRKAWEALKTAKGARR